nr:conserved membrane protein of unknown function [Candidatus Magnetococcus massalia]
MDWLPSGWMIPLVLGVVSTLHCSAMCGGIMGAISFGVPQWQQSGMGRRLLYLVAANLGRLTSYVMMGLLLATLGSQLMMQLPGSVGHEVLRTLAALILLLMGFYLAGRAHWFSQVERLGAPLWRLLEPVTKRLLPIRNPGVAYLFGMLWGWLPCALVYAALFWSSAAPTATEGALRMALFGLGTFPAMLGVGLAVKQLQSSRLRWQQLAGWMLVVMGLVTYMVEPHNLLWMPDTIRTELPCVEDLCTKPE